jgi:hypothetical protein
MLNSSFGLLSSDPLEILRNSGLIDYITRLSTSQLTSFL